MSRLSLQVVYLWRHVLSTVPPFILWWSNLEILFTPLHRSSPFIRGLRCQAIQMEHGPYITERIQKAVYIVRCLWRTYTIGTVCTSVAGPHLWKVIALCVFLPGKKGWKHHDTVTVIILALSKTKHSIINLYLHNYRKQSTKRTNVWWAASVHILWIFQKYVQCK
jgi:hypothetical protein